MDRIVVAGGLLLLILVLLAIGRVWVALRKRRILARERKAARRWRAEFATAGSDGNIDRVLFFTTETCVQCHEMQAPALERLRSSWSRTLVVEEVDAIERRDLAQQYGVMTVPSTVVFANGEARAVNYGFVSEEKIARQLAGDAYAI